MRITPPSPMLLVAALLSVDAIHADDALRVFEGGQGQDCWRAHEYRTRGIDIGLVLPWYASPTALADQGMKDARGILLGWPRKPHEFELHCPRSIERPDQEDSIRILSVR